jgi:hypothetical protein
MTTNMRATTTISLPLCLYSTRPHFLRAKLQASPRGLCVPFALGSVFAAALVRGYETFEMLLRNVVQPSRGWFPLFLLAWLRGRRRLAVVSSLAGSRV